jgi:hypothetical protein
VEVLGEWVNTSIILLLLNTPKQGGGSILHCLPVTYQCLFPTAFQSRHCLAFEVFFDNVVKVKKWYVGAILI